jgi:hypothetical protein
LLSSKGCVMNDFAASSRFWIFRSLEILNNGRTNRHDG